MSSLHGYGRVRTAADRGLPTDHPPRARKNADGRSGFSLVDPAGNWLRLFHDRRVEGPPPEQILAPESVRRPQPPGPQPRRRWRSRQPQPGVGVRDDDGHQHALKGRRVRRATLRVAPAPSDGLTDPLGAGRGRKASILQ